ncbi:hypothetical protein EJ110_NYTH04721 [Nymphaea thermarum]|nr:hypothetical protein EJ110_NYTH04721 [Nymphaea thermarum]
MKSSPFSSLITKMNGGNYEMWAMQVKRTLIAHDKELLILEPEPVQKVGKYVTWCKDNSLVMVWIVGTLSQDIANEVLHKESAKDMWDSLAATYSHARNETKIMQLHHDIHQMCQDGRPLHAYYSSLKSMFERLNSYFPTCKCEQQKAYRDMLMVGVFLSGLDSVYESAKNQMLTSPSIPPIDEAYSRLSRILISAATVPDTTSAMLATRGRGGSFFARGRGGCGRGPPTSRPVCQFCHRIGHTVDKCWQKHGRPAFANQTASTESPEQPKVQHTAPSSELRVDDLLSQLHSLIGDRPQHASDPTTTTVTTAASASSSGMCSAYTASPATDTTDWLIDSGASTHLWDDLDMPIAHRKGKRSCTLHPISGCLVTFPVKGFVRQAWRCDDQGSGGTTATSRAESADCRAGVAARVDPVGHAQQGRRCRWWMRRADAATTRRAGAATSRQRRHVLRRYFRQGSASGGRLVGQAPFRFSMLYGGGGAATADAGRQMATSARLPVSTRTALCLTPDRLKLSLTKTFEVSLSI